MGTAQIPQIERLVGRENYETWKFAVEAYLRLDDLWCVIDGTLKSTDSHFADKDRKAKSKLILLVDPVNYVHIENTANAQEVWNKLRKAFEDGGLARRVGLLRELITTQLNQCKNVEDYVNKIISTSNRLRNIGFQIADEWVGTLLLAGLSEK